jgi:NAD(P)-dependent dehydrogenase (short-subunit alcohol dehydrogenase family)
VTPDLFDLTGRVAVVTGGSRGLGREMVRAFAAAGADVVIASRKLESCDALASEVRADTGRRALPVACHVGRWDDVDALVDTVYSEFGQVDVLVNNAGMAPLYSSLGAVTEELFDKVVGVNLKGPFRLSALVGERMVEGDGGAIVNISSLAAVRPGAGDLPYAAAKAGLNTLTAGFAAAFGPKVRVNGVMVGPFLTDISKAWDVEGFTAFAAERYPLGKLGQPEQIVGTVLYLATEASSFTTGTVLTVDGGVSVSSPFPT